MENNKEINVNQVNYSVYRALAKAVFSDYENTFNGLNPTRRVGFNVTLTPATISMYDVLLKQGKYTSKEEMQKLGIKDEKMDVRYLRVGKFFEKISYHTPILEEFKVGFIYQQLDIIGKVWEELKFEEGDTITEDKITKGEVRVERRSREKEVVVYQQSIKLKSSKEILNDKWWKRILYLDLVNTLMAKGIEYGEVLGLVQRAEEEKAVLARELGESAKEVLEANKIVIRKEMPKPLTSDDEAYKREMGKLRAQEEKKKGKS